MKSEDIDKGRPGNQIDAKYSTKEDPREQSRNLGQKRFINDSIITYLGFLILFFLLCPPLIFLSNDYLFLRT